MDKVLHLGSQLLDDDLLAWLAGDNTVLDLVSLREPVVLLAEENEELGRDDLVLVRGHVVSVPHEGLVVGALIADAGLSFLWGEHGKGGMLDMFKNNN